MARLDVWAPRGSRTRGLLLEVQSDLHAAALSTRPEPHFRPFIEAEARPV